MTRTVLSAVIVMTALIPGSLSGGLGMPEEDATVSDTSTVRPHQPGEDHFRSALSEDLEWKPFPAFPPSVRLANLVEEGLLPMSGAILWHGNHVSNHKT